MAVDFAVVSLFHCEHEVYPAPIQSVDIFKPEIPSADLEQMEDVFRNVFFFYVFFH